MGYQLHPCYSSFIAFGAKISLESITPTGPPLSGSSLLVYVLAIPHPNISLRTISTMMLSWICIVSYIEVFPFDHSSLYTKKKKIWNKDISKNFKNPHKEIDSIFPLISQFHGYLNILLFSPNIFIREIVFLLNNH